MSEDSYKYAKALLALAEVLRKYDIELTPDKFGNVRIVADTSDTYETIFSAIYIDAETLEGAAHCLPD